MSANSLWNGLIDVSGMQCFCMLCVAQCVKDTHYNTLLREIKMQKRIPCPNVILILESRYAIIFHVNSLLNILWLWLALLHSPKLL